VLAVLWGLAIGVPVGCVAGGWWFVPSPAAARLPFASYASESAGGAIWSAIPLVLLAFSASVAGESWFLARRRRFLVAGVLGASMTAVAWIWFYLQVAAHWRRGGGGGVDIGAAMVVGLSPLVIGTGMWGFVTSRAQCAD
jgi:hypothetical protein